EGRAADHRRGGERAADPDVKSETRPWDGTRASWRSQTAQRWSPLLRHARAGRADAGPVVNGSPAREPDMIDECCESQRPRKGASRHTGPSKDSNPTTRLQAVAVPRDPRRPVARPGARAGTGRHPEPAERPRRRVALAEGVAAVGLQPGERVDASRRP